MLRGGVAAVSCCPRKLNEGPLERKWIAAELGAGLRHDVLKVRGCRRVISMMMSTRQGYAGSEW